MLGCIRDGPTPDRPITRQLQARPGVLATGADCRYGGPIGHRMFHGPASAAQRLQADWHASNTPQ